MRLIIIGFFSLWVNLSLAAITPTPTPINNPLKENTVTFNVKEANKQFDHLNLQLSVQNLNLSNLNAAIKTLTDLVGQSDGCVNSADKRLTSLDSLIQQATHSTDGKDTGADLVYLTTEQKKLASTQAQCRLFSIRAKEAMDAYQNAIAQLKQEEALTRGLPLWSIVERIIDNPTKELSTSVHLEIPTQLNSLLTLAYILGACLLTASLILFKMNKNSFIRHYIRIKAIRISHILLLTLCLFFGAITAYLSLLMLQQQLVNPLLFYPTLGIFGYLVSVLATIFIFKIKKVKAFLYWYKLDSTFFRSLIIFLLTFYALSIIGRLLAHNLSLNNTLWQLSQSLFLLAVITTAIYFIYYFCRAHRYMRFIKQHRHALQRLYILFCMTCIVIDILGYHILAMHLTFASITTFAILFTTIIIEQAVNKLYLLCIHQSHVRTKILQVFGYKQEQTLTEFLILKTTLQVIIFGAGLYLISRCWGYATYYIESAYTHFLYGIHFGNFTIYPTRIVAGIIVFCILYLLFRSISTALSRHEQFEDEEETQVAVASILTYVGFAFAMITALLVAGFDFTGLAIVAGALSVGIGLGLQSIVNNFVSGIILLIEKPIKSGDKINVDGTEGVVKKIRVRSTQISTSAHEDVIIPNSDLITRRVINYMFSDKYISIHCEVGVAYGSNTELVRDTLLEVAAGHEEVVKTGRNKPSVLFRSFGENALIFQVWFVIKDVNKKSNVRSEINFAIERAFRHHQIEMAFPQREVHLKFSDVPPWLSNGSSDITN